MNTRERFRRKIKKEDAMFRLRRSPVSFLVGSFFIIAILMGVWTRFVLANPAYEPGETLDPSCAPTDPDCRVVPRGQRTFIVADIAGRDALTELQSGDHVIVTSEEKTYIWSQSDAWLEVPHTYPSHTHVVPNLAALNELGTTHALQTGDHAEVVDVSRTYVYTQEGVWQELLSPVTRTYVVPDLNALNALTNIQIGDHAEVTDISKSYIRTQDNVWQELLIPPNTITLESVYVVPDQATRDALTDLSSGDLAILTDTNTTYVYTQDSVWQEILTPPDRVYSVNGHVGNVVLTSDDIAEGGTHPYFSNQRARAALSVAAPLSYDSGAGMFSLAVSAPLDVNGSNLVLNAGELDIGSLNGTLPVNKGGTGRTAVGGANQILAVNGLGDALEYKTLTAGSNIAIVHGTGSANISVSNTPTFNSVNAGSLSMNSGTPITGHVSVTEANVTSASITNRTCGAYATISVPGAVIGNTVVASPTPVTGGIETVNLTWTSYVSSANTVTIRACNVANAGSINTANTQTWRVDVWAH